MTELNNEELIKIEGGVLKSTASGFIIGGIITFAIGFINGILRPLGCSSTI